MVSVFLEMEEKIKALCFNYNIMYIIPIFCVSRIDLWFSRRIALKPKFRAFQLRFFRSPVGSLLLQIK